MRRAGLMAVMVLLLTILLVVPGWQVLKARGLHDQPLTPTRDGRDISLRLVGEEPDVAGTTYTIELINGTSHVIKQNTMALSYPLKGDDYNLYNNCEALARNNRLNIKPGDKIILNIFMPVENYQNNPNLDYDHPFIFMEGYYDTVSDKNIFYKHFSPRGHAPEALLAKPVIYLYPTHSQAVTVKLDLIGKLGTTYPEYNDGWRVLSASDGTLTDLKDKREYSYLFWDGVTSNARWDLTKGFVVAGKDSRTFLQNKLSALGLLPREYNEFIVCWLPLLEKNKYNLITFAGREYTDIARLQINPEPESMLRVFMVFKAIDMPFKIEPQVIVPFKRQGFTVVEWGGTEIK